MPSASAAPPPTGSPAPTTLRAQSLPSVPRLPRPSAPVAAPLKRIQSEEDVDLWKSSEAHRHLTLYVARLCEAAVGAPTRVTDDATLSAEPQPVRKILELLDAVDRWTTEVEPEQTPQRFGNKAFRKWGERLEGESAALHDALLPEELRTWTPELGGYFHGAFGNWSRLDYGSGHELSFAAWLCVLERIGFFAEAAQEVESSTETKPPSEVERSVATLVFPRYLEVVWRIQDRYGLEPAGSHGVWGLDDYQFLPYAIGAAQLRTQTDYPPSAVSRPSHKPSPHHRSPRELLTFLPSVPLQRDALSNSRQTDVPPFANLYTSSIARIHSLKTGPFHEHSPILNDVATTVASWVKVHQGMLKMWDAECLGKRPVVQHFVFGRALPWPESGGSGAAGGRSQASYSSLGATTMARPSAPTGAGTMRPTPAPWAQGGTSRPVAMPPPPSVGGGGTPAPWALGGGGGAGTELPTRLPPPTGYTSSTVPRFNPSRQPPGPQQQEQRPPGSS